MFPCCVVSLPAMSMSSRFAVLIVGCWYVGNNSCDSSLASNGALERSKEDMSDPPGESVSTWLMRGFPGVKVILVFWYVSVGFGVLDWVCL